MRMETTLDPKGDPISKIKNKKMNEIALTENCPNYIFLLFLVVS
jgi:hypothetical protein